MKKTMIALMAAEIFAVGLTVQAQTNVPAPNPVVVVTPAPNPVAALSINTITTLLQNGIITIGQPTTLTINGQTQTFTVNTNPAGLYVISTSGSAGTATVTQPTTTAEVFAQMQSMIANNNPTNRDYYGTNELVARVGAIYLQNSGQAAIEIGVEKYGLFKSLPQFGIGAALFQGNKQGQSATAGAIGFIDYRYIIGDVSAQIGLGGGYDNWNKCPIGVVKFDIEYRMSPHMGTYVGLGYGLEQGSINNSQKGGLMARAGANWSFGGGTGFLGL
jgi:hypothetical protein